MAMNETELLKLKNEIDSAKTKVAGYEGEKKSLLVTLLEQFDCKTLKEAEEKVVIMQKEVDIMNVEIDKDIAEIERRYGTME